MQRNAKKRQLSRPKDGQAKGLSVSPPPAQPPVKVTQPTQPQPPQKPEAQTIQKRRSQLIREFNFKKYVGMNISRDEVIELKQAFDIFDEDGSGTLEPQELIDAFKEMGFNAHAKMIYQVLAELDRDNSGGIDFDEFFRLALARPATRSRKEIERSFQLFDVNVQGKITWQELRNVAKALGEEISDQDLQAHFNKADLDQDGFVTLEDFYNIMTDSKVYYQ